MDNRIERINGNNYYEYEKIKNLKVPDAEEKFSLDYKNESFSTKAKDKEDKEEEDKNSAQATLQNGVRLEISNEGRRTGSGTNAKRTPDTAAKTETSHTLNGQISSLLESIRRFFTDTIAAVKALFDKVWNEPSAENTAKKSAIDAEEIFSDDAEPTESVNTPLDKTILNNNDSYEDPQEAALAMKRNEALLDREIRPYLKSGDLEQVISLLTDNGRKTAARNSTLLTYYDKNGRMVEPNASDRERILHGDRNTRKL